MRAERKRGSDELDETHLGKGKKGKLEVNDGV